MVFGPLSPEPKYDRLARGTNTTTPIAGAITAEDKTKLDNLPAPFELITYIVGTSTPFVSVTFSNMSTGYRDLQLRIVGRGDVAALNVGVYVQFNFDATANYDQQYQYAQGPSAGASETLATATPLLGYLAAANAIAGGVGRLVIDIPDFHGPWLKTAHTVGHVKQTNAANGEFLTTTEVAWRSAAAITYFTVQIASGNFAPNTRLTLYGIRDTF